MDEAVNITATDKDGEVVFSGQCYDLKLANGTITYNEEKNVPPLSIVQGVITGEITYLNITYYSVRKPLGLVKDAGSGIYKIHFVIFKVHFSFPIPPALGDLILKADAALLKILERLHRLTTFPKSVK